jgi:hypothetical protein
MSWRPPEALPDAGVSASQRSVGWVGVVYAGKSAAILFQREFRTPQDCSAYSASEHGPDSQDVRRTPPAR